MEGLLEYGQVWFVDGAQELRRDRKNKVVGGSDVCQDKGWVLDVDVGGNGLVNCLNSPVGSILAVVGCGCEAEDYEPVRRWVRLREYRLLAGLLLTPDLCEFHRLLLYYLCVGLCRGWNGLLGGGWFRSLLGWCQRVPRGYWNGYGGGTYGEDGDFCGEIVDGVGQGEDLFLRFLFPVPDVLKPFDLDGC